MPVSFNYTPDSYNNASMTQQGYVVELDFLLISGNVENRSQSQFIVPTEGPDLISTSAYTGSDYVFSLSQPTIDIGPDSQYQQGKTSAKSQLWYINDLANSAGSTVTLNENWYHLILTVTTSSVSYSISQGGSIVASGSKDVESLPVIKGFTTLVGRGSGRLNFDNLDIYDYTESVSVTAPSFTFNCVNGVGRDYVITNPNGNGTMYYTTSPAETAPAIGDAAYTAEANTSKVVTFSESGKYYAYVLHSNGETASTIVKQTVTAGAITLSSPVFTVTDMVLGEDGHYYPKVAFSSDNSGKEGTPTATLSVSSPYTFTQLGILEVTASCEGYTSSSATFDASKYYTLTKTIDFGAMTADDFDAEIWESSTGNLRDYWTNRAAAIPANTTFFKLKDPTTKRTDAIDGITISNSNVRQPQVYIGYGLYTPYELVSGNSNNMNLTVNDATADDYAVYNGWNNYGGGTFNTVLAGDAIFGLYRYDTMLRNIKLYSPVAESPALSLDKTSANVNAGDAVSFTATLTQGSPAPTIQWYSCDDAEKTNPVAIDGATSNTYSPSTANPGTYYYYVKAENTLGSAESDVITLTVTGVVATPTFTIASFDYEHDGYTITPVCTTEGATLTYTIGNGEAQPCTSGVPFYAKDGKLVITASKDGWTSASIPESQQYTLNAAPSATSPETLISFNLSSDNGDKNLEHVYKSVTIAGGNNGAIGGIGSGATGKLKLRTNQSGNTLTLNVNEGYKVTKVTVEANSNNSGSGATIGLTSVTVDGGENIVTEPTTFPISSAAAVTYNTGDISAASNIVFTFDNSNITGETNKKNNQIIASITVWYKTPTELAIDEAIADCKANEPSAEFATYIDGGSYASVRDVYVAHTNWQIAQGSNDLTKLIRNAAVVDGSDWGGAYTNHSEQYTGAPDEYYLDRWNATINTNQTIYGVPAGTYIIKAATRASVGTPGTLYVNDGSSDVAKVNQITNVGNTGGDLGNGWSWSEMTFTLTETKDLLIGFWADCSNENWAGCDDWHMTVLETPVTVGANGYTTFASPFALDLTDENRPEGLKAYKATLTGKTLSFTELNQTVAAGTGLLLLGETEGGTYNIPVVATGDAVETALTGVITPTAKQSSDADDYYFVMKKAKTAEDALTFAPLSTTKEVTIPAGKAYVTVPSSAFGGSESRSLGISFDEITGIAEVNGRLDNVRGEIYNLKGQRVAQPAKGLYIMNGKKVIIK